MKQSEWVWYSARLVTLCTKQQLAHLLDPFCSHPFPFFSDDDTGSNLIEQFLPALPTAPNTFLREDGWFGATLVIGYVSLTSVACVLACFRRCCCRVIGVSGASLKVFRRLGVRVRDIHLETIFPMVYVGDVTAFSGQYNDDHPVVSLLSTQGTVLHCSASLLLECGVSPLRGPAVDVCLPGLPLLDRCVHGEF